MGAWSMHVTGETGHDDGGMTATFAVLRDEVHVADVDATITGAGAWTVVWTAIEGGVTPVDFRAWVKEA